MQVVRSVVLALSLSTSACSIGSQATRQPSDISPSPVIAGIWDAVVRSTINEGMGSGDTRIERQEWHLQQAGSQISGFYVVALTMVSGDGRPYVCSREPQFSSMLRFDVRGQVSSGVIDLEEVAQEAQHSRCSAGARPLTRYQGKLRGDVLTLAQAGATSRRQSLYRRQGGAAVGETQLRFDPSGSQAVRDVPFPALDRPPAAASGQRPSADLSGVWVWEHHGVAPGGDEKHEREEWHLTQEGASLSGYYDRLVRQISTDGQAYRCSMAMEFRISTRYRIHGEVSGDQVVLYEQSFEVLEPNACDSGKRRLDAYQGQASTEEIRLVWGVGGQVLRRARPDVPTQRF